MKIKMDTPTLKEKTGTLKIWRLLLIGLLVTCMLFLIWTYSGKTTKRLWKERSSNFELFMTQYTKTIEQVCESQWDTVESLYNRLLAQGEVSLEQYLQTLAYMEQETPDDDIRFLLFSDRGMCYDSAGVERHWNEWEDLLSADSRHLRIYNLYGTMQETEQLIFLYRVPEELVSGQETYTHLALVRDMNSFDDIFTTTAFGEESSTFIINPDGTQIYHEEHQNSAINAYNILHAIKEDEFLYDTTYEQLQKDLAEGETGCVHFEHKNAHQMLGYHPMGGGSDWIVAVLVPASQVSTGTLGFLRYTVIYTGMVALTITLILVALLLYGRRRIKKDMEQANHHLKIAAETERAANKAKSEFLSHISHDIRTPINGIKGMVHIAKQNMNDPEMLAHCIQRIDQSAAYLHSLINDVLDMSRIETRKMIITCEPTQLQQLCKECVSLVEEQILQKQIQFVCDFGGLPQYSVLADATHLRQVLVNILSNAMKFTDGGGQILFKAKGISATKELIQAEFSIKDTGCGMSEEFQSRIYEPFSQEIGRFQDTYEGTGLGMAIVKKLVEAMGGSIRFESELGKGSTFTVCLSFEVATEAADKTKSAETSVSPDGIKALVVEDNDVNLEAIRFMLAELNVQISIARNGQEAVDVFQSRDDLDVILMDVSMPVMNGLEATRSIRSLEGPNAKTTPIIAMTANAFTEDIRIAIDAGMNDYIIKPVDPEKLKTLLGNLVNEGKRESECSET